MSIFSKWDQMSDSEREASKKRAEASRIEIDEQWLSNLRERERDGFTSLTRDDQELCKLSLLRVIGQNQKVIKAMTTWNPLATRKGMLFFGDVGTGKSTLMKCIINKWATNDYRCKFVIVPNVLQTFKDAIKDGSVQMEVDKLIGYDLLALDDLGTEKDTEWTYEKLFSVIDERIRFKKHTLISSNLSKIQLLTRYGPRIFDRITSACRPFEMNGESFRILNNNPNEW